MASQQQPRAGDAAPGSRRRAPRMTPEDRREAVLDAALALIDRDGYRGANMEAIAREAGVTKPVLYHLFGSLGDLLRELFEREEERALEQLAAAMPSLPSERDPDELLADGFRAFLDAVAARPLSWRLILRSTDGTPREVRDYVARYRRTLTTQLETLIAWGVERRGGPEGLDVELAARSIIGLGEQSALLVIAEPQRFTPERVGRFVSGLLAGFAPAGDRAP